MKRHWLIEFFKWDIRTILAASLGLAVLIGLTWAATAGSLVVKFDFGGASTIDKDPDSVQVVGGLSIYPKTAGVFQYGWTSPSINEFVDRNVTDRVRRDYNTGANGSVFRVAGLNPGVYSFQATVGASNVGLSTKMQSGALATSVTTTAGNWEVATLNVAVDNTGMIDLAFSSDNQLDSWGICGLSIYVASETTAVAGFEATLLPSQKTMRAGDTAVFSLGIAPLNNYASRVSATINGLVSGMTAEFIPAQVSSPPGVMELRVYTKTTVPPTIYDLVITAKGDDAASTQKIIHVKLTLTAANTLSPDIVAPTGNGATMNNQPTNQDVELPPRTAQQMQEDFAKVETFVAEQKAKALQENNFTEIGDIGDALVSGAPIYTDLPKPTSITESFLQKMVSAGIIGTISDAAPQVQATPEPQGFWEKVFLGIFRPAS